MLGLVAARSVQVPDDLVRSILAPYRPTCRYLLRATIDFVRDHEDAAGGAIVGRGDFSIPESFYIDDTGHFNAVEFNICFNQLGYVFLGYCVQHGLIHAMREMAFEQYMAQQLPGVLIAELRSAFKRPMNARDFRGAISIATVDESRNYWALRMPCEFADAKRGKSEGEGKVAVLKPR